jgi:hypothetical protein
MSGFGEVFGRGDDEGRVEFDGELDDTRNRFAVVRSAVDVIVFEVFEIEARGFITLLKGGTKLFVVVPIFFGEFGFVSGTEAGLETSEVGVGDGVVFLRITEIEFIEDLPF